MNVKDFDFELPQELIAQDPLEDRSSSRLLVLDKKTGEIEHRTFRDILSYLRKGDCLVINDTKVIPARLFGVKEGTEAKIEILLLKRRENDIWETLVKPGKKAKIGTVITLSLIHIYGSDPFHAGYQINYYGGLQFRQPVVNPRRGAGGSDII